MIKIRIWLIADANSCFCDLFSSLWINNCVFINLSWGYLWRTHTFLKEPLRWPFTWDQVIYLFFIESNCFRSLSNLLWNDQHNETTFSVITAFIKPCALMAGMSQTSCLCQCIDVSQQINISHCYRWIDSSQRGEHQPINRCILTSISSLNVVLHLTHLINGMFVWCGHSMAQCGTPQFRKNFLRFSSYITWFL